MTTLEATHYSAVTKSRRKLSKKKKKLSLSPPERCKMGTVEVWEFAADSLPCRLQADDRDRRRTRCDLGDTSSEPVASSRVSVCLPLRFLSLPDALQVPSLSPLAFSS